MSGREKNKLNLLDVQNIKTLYAKGKKLAQIKKLLNLDVDRKTIYYWIHKVQKNTPPVILVEKVVKPRIKKILKDTWFLDQEIRQREQYECSHIHFQCTCSKCGKILGSDVLNNAPSTVTVLIDG